MTFPRQTFAIWLVPAPREHEFFTRTISELGTRFDAPLFEPHLTLHGGELDLEQAARGLQQIPAAGKYELEVEGVHSSGKYTQTLFVRFHLSAELRELRTAVGDVFNLETGAEFDPHLSLLYKEMPEAEKAALAESVEIPFQQVTFEALKLIAHPPKVAVRADVEAFREIGRRCLTSDT